MRLLYLGCFVEPSQQDYLERQAKAVITVSTTTFQRAFLSGFEKSRIKPDIINCPDIGSWPQRCKKIKIPSSTVSYYGMRCRNVSFYNISYLKRKSITASLEKEIDKWMIDKKDEKVFIIVYSMIYSYLKAAIDTKKKYNNVEVCCIVLDLPEFFGDNSSLLYKVTSGSTKKTYELVYQVDSFILLTKYMTKPLQVGKKPWMLMEGIYAPRLFEPVQKHSKTVLYTGKLDKRFGLRELVDNFSSLDGDIELWICGNGLDKKYVEEAARKDRRIKYFGQVKQDRVLKMQREASLLINPRKPEGEYTKYSFPSKTMEYMASGTPTLMYRLPGMPIDYDDKVVLFNDMSDKTFCTILKEWLNKPQEELDAFGEKARKFILDNKTAEKQIARFLDFITKIYGE